MRNGYGKEYRPNGLHVLYEGEWTDGMRVGCGKEYYPDSTLLYDGEYKNGMWDGHGTKFWPASFNTQMLWQTDFCEHSNGQLGL